MAEVEGAAGISKSAKRRQAKKAKEAAEKVEAEEVAAPPPPPVAEPKSKAKAKAKPEAKAKAEPKAEPKAKAKAEPKAEPKAAAKATPKAKGKAKAEPKAEPKAVVKEPPAAPAPPAPAAKGKAKSKAAAKAKAAAKKGDDSDDEPAPPVKKKVEDDMINYRIDDGSGGSWETAAGVSSKQAKRNKKISEEKAYKEAYLKTTGGVEPKNMVPGMAPLDPRMTAQQKLAASQAVSADVARILATKGAEEEKPIANLAMATITVPDQKIGVVIGPKGATIKLIQEKTKVARIDTSGNIFTITGPAAAVSEAETAIKELIEKSYCSLLFEDFSENFANVHPCYFPDIIGVKGAVIQRMKKELKVEVNMPTTPEGANRLPKKYKVMLAGSAKQVEEAKEVINSIMMYSHHEVTHPGFTHAELEVDSWSFKYIIGKGGSEMKHIQKNWDVKVCMPREFSLNKNVVIVGEPSNVERAKVYVEKVLWNAENQVKSGRDNVDTGDVWGEEEDEEPWMKQYMYRRH